MNIESEILDYINCNENTGALLLTGPWGCGKSYLMKQIAKDLNQEKAAAIAVISLFGLDSISDSCEYSTPENMQHTTENFEKLIDFLKSLDDTDSIAKLINAHISDKISSKLNR